MRFICVYIELQWLLLPRFYRIGEIIAIWPALGWFQGPYMGNADTFSCLRYNWHWRYPSQKLFVKELRSASLQLIHDYPQVLRHLPVAYLQICFCYSNMTTALGKCSLHHCQPLPPKTTTTTTTKGPRKKSSQLQTGIENPGDSDLPSIEICSEKKLLHGRRWSLPGLPAAHWSCCMSPRRILQRLGTFQRSERWKGVLLGRFG